MSNNKELSETIENYLQNKLSDTEKMDFEVVLEKDPLLKNEVELQSDIINSIKGNRYNELKTRLNNIDVGGIPQGFNFIKVAATVSVGSIITVGSFFYFNNDDNSLLDQIDLDTYTKVELNSNSIPAMPQAEVITEIGEPIELNNDQSESFTVVEENSLNESKNQANLTSEIKDNITKPNLVIPENSAPSNIEPVDSEDLEVVTGAFYNGQNNPNILVNNLGDQEYDFHYQFENGTLSLYGEFDKMPYELIELNTDQGKMLFLYYNEDFHLINTSQPKVTPLEKINNQGLLDELNIIINSKSR